ncbi:MAG: glycosyltransferase family 2 protein, partial [Blastocatellia bacterium]
LTTLSNMMTNLNLTDMEVCYKVFKADVIKNINLKSNRFEFEPEITAKVAKKGCRVYEVPISYSGRDYSEGKKIGWKDGVTALWCIFKYRFMN